MLDETSTRFFVSLFIFVFFFRTAFDSCLGVIFVPQVVMMGTRDLLWCAVFMGLLCVQIVLTQQGQEQPVQGQEPPVQQQKPPVEKASEEPAPARVESPPKAVDGTQQQQAATRQSGQHRTPTEAEQEAVRRLHLQKQQDDRDKKIVSEFEQRRAEAGQLQAAAEEEAARQQQQMQQEEAIRLKHVAEQQRIAAENAARVDELNQGARRFLKKEEEKAAQMMEKDREVTPEKKLDDVPPEDLPADEPLEEPLVEDLPAEQLAAAVEPVSEDLEEHPQAASTDEEPDTTQTDDVDILFDEDVEFPGRVGSPDDGNPGRKSDDLVEIKYIDLMEGGDLSKGIGPYTEFPEPIDMSELPVDKVNRILRVRTGNTEVQTTIVFEPDEFGQARMVTYTQKLSKEGEVTVEVEESFETIFELVSHKEQLAAGLAEAAANKQHDPADPAPSYSADGPAVQDQPQGPDNEGEEEDEEDLTLEQKAGESGSQPMSDGLASVCGCCFVYFCMFSLLTLLLLKCLLLMPQS